MAPNSQPKVAADGANPKTTGPAAEKLVEGLRELIRQELGNPAPPPEQKPEPSWQDKVWLVVLIANIALLISLTPSHWVKDPRLEFLRTLVPWLGGGILLIHSDWFRDRLMTLGRRRDYRLLQAALLLSLLAVRSPLFALRPIVLPGDAVLSLNDRPEDHSRKLWLTLQNYKIRLTPAKGDGSEERHFQLSWTELMRAALGGAQPEWTLCYPFRWRINSQLFPMDESAKLVIVRSRGSFDRDFQPVKPLQKVNEKTVEHPVIAALGAAVLPLGHYQVRLQKGPCTSQPQPLEVTQNIKEIEFRELPCP